MTECLYFHHVGVACQNIEAEAEALAVLGYAKEGEDFRDPIQGVSGRFLVGPGPRLELLTEVQGSQTLRPWLSRGIKMYHQAFEVDVMETVVVELEREGAHVVAGAVKSAAFGGRYITFLMMANHMLIELIERTLPREQRLDAKSIDYGATSEDPASRTRPENAPASRIQLPSLDCYQETRLSDR